MLSQPDWPGNRLAGLCHQPPLRVHECLGTGSKGEHSHEYPRRPQVRGQARQRTRWDTPIPGPDPTVTPNPALG